MPADSGNSAEKARALADFLRDTRAHLATVRMTPLAVRLERERAAFEGPGAALVELRHRALVMRARVDAIGVIVPDVVAEPAAEPVEELGTEAPTTEAPTTEAPTAEAPAQVAAEEEDRSAAVTLTPVEDEDLSAAETLPPGIFATDDVTQDALEQLDDPDSEDDFLPPLAPLTREDTDVIENLGMPEEVSFVEESEPPEDFEAAVLIEDEEDDDEPDTVEDEPILMEAEARPDDSDEIEPEGQTPEEEREAAAEAEILAQLEAEEAELRAQADLVPGEDDDDLVPGDGDDALVGDEGAHPSLLDDLSPDAFDEPVVVDNYDIISDEDFELQAPTLEPALAEDEPVPGSEEEPEPSSEDSAERFTREMLMEMLEQSPSQEPAADGDEEATMLMSSADVRRALAGELEAASGQAARSTVTLDELDEVGLDDLDDDLDEELLLEDDEGLDELPAQGWGAKDADSTNLLDDYGQAILPTIRDHRDPRPSAAAIRISAQGQEVTGTPIGLEYLEEVKVALGPADDDDDYDLAEAGSGLFVEAHDADEYEDIEEEFAAPVLTPETDGLDVAPLELNEEDVAPVDEVDNSQLAAFFEKANGALENGDLPSAVMAYSDLLDLDPTNVEAYLGRGRCHLDLGDYAAAMSDFQKAEDIDPEGPEPLVAMGELFFARKDYGRAIEFFNHAIESDGSHAMARCRRGISYYYKKNYRQAFLDLQKAYTLDPDIPNIKKYVQMAIKKLERSGEA